MASVFGSIGSGAPLPSCGLPALLLSQVAVRHLGPVAAAVMASGAAVAAVAQPGVPCGPGRPAKITQAGRMRRLQAGLPTHPQEAAATGRRAGGSTGGVSW
jgi:hypothetical protein